MIQRGLLFTCFVLQLREWLTSFEHKPNWFQLSFTKRNGYREYVVLIMAVRMSKLTKMAANMAVKFNTFRFFPQTIRDWNDLPDSRISSAELPRPCI